MSLFSTKEKQKIKRLEETLESYREDNKNLREENERLRNVELKLKIMQMYVDDDEAILELLECQKVRDKARFMELINQQQMNPYRALGACGGTLLGGLGGRWCR